MTSQWEDLYLAAATEVRRPKLTEKLRLRAILFSKPCTADRTLPKKAGWNTPSALCLCLRSESAAGSLAASSCPLRQTRFKGSLAEYPPFRFPDQSPF